MSGVEATKTVIVKPVTPLTEAKPAASQPLQNTELLAKGFKFPEAINAYDKAASGTPADALSNNTPLGAALAGVNTQDKGDSFFNNLSLFGGSNGSNEAEENKNPIIKILIALGILPPGFEDTNPALRSGEEASINTTKELLNRDYNTDWTEKSRGTRQEYTPEQIDALVRGIGTEKIRNNAPKVLSPVEFTAKDDSINGIKDMQKPEFNGNQVQLVKDTIKMFDRKVQGLIQKGIIKSEQELVNLVLAMIKQESEGKSNAVSHKGATGLMQVMPGTANGIAKQLGETNVNMKDPAQNVRFGVYYILCQLEKSKSIPLALAAYNAGPDAVAKAGGVPNFSETKKYIAKITADKNNMDRQTGVA